MSYNNSIYVTLKNLFKTFHTPHIHWFSLAFISHMKTITITETMYFWLPL